MNTNQASNGSKPRVVFAATDFSESADEALRQAHERARAAGARLVVCHVVPNLMRHNMLFPQRFAEQIDARADLHRQALDALITHTRQITGRTEVEFEAVIDDGTPHASIVEHAERVHADLILVGDRGATGLARMLLGSVAEGVLRYAHSPVLIVRAGAKSGKILVATDLSDPSLPALVAAGNEARRVGARVTVLHCIESAAMSIGAEFGFGWSLLLGIDAIEKARQSAQENLEQTFQRLQIEGDRRVVEGAPAACILHAAQELDADLIVLGTRGRTGLERALLGSVAEAVVRHSHCSVLAVRLHEGNRLQVAAVLAR